MWMATTLGFYSIVKNGEEYRVRARLKRDLENLVDAAGLDLEVKGYDKSDYRYRIVLDAEGYARVMAAIAEAVDYPNFKNAVKKHRDQVPKLPIYHDWWSDMLRLQPSRTPAWDAPAVREILDRVAAERAMLGEDIEGGFTEAELDELLESCSSNTNYYRDVGLPFAEPTLFTDRGPAEPTAVAPEDEDPDEDLPLLTCPSCGREQRDYDGFGLLACTGLLDGSCSYCTHPTASAGDDGNGGTVYHCTICGKVGV